MTVIDPKPTQYRGIQFKSVLEARWAVFLDHHFLVEDWRYELRSFNHPSLQGHRYTPDFWFSVGGMELWVEAKPVEPEEDYIKLINDLSYYWKITLLLGVGSFYKDEPEVYLFPSNEYCPGAKLSNFGVLGCDDGKAVSIAQRFRFDITGPSYRPPRKEANPTHFLQRTQRWIKDVQKKNRRRP